MTANLEKIIEDLSSLSALEVANLAKMLEEKWGVKAAVAVAGPVAGSNVSAEEEKDSFTVVLESAGDNKINVIKEVRAITGLGLKEAKDLVDGAPKNVKENIKKDEAESIKAKLEAAGAKVKLS